MLQRYSPPRPAVQGTPRQPLLVQKHGQIRLGRCLVQIESHELQAHVTHDPCHWLGQCIVADACHHLTEINGSERMGCLCIAALLSASAQPATWRCPELRLRNDNWTHVPQHPATLNDCNAVVSTSQMGTPQPSHRPSQPAESTMTHLCMHLSPPRLWPSRPS